MLSWRLARPLGRAQAGDRSHLSSILRELQNSKIDGEEFIRLRQQIEELRRSGEEETYARSCQPSDHRRALIDEWENLKSAEYRARTAAKKVTKQLTGVFEEGHLGRQSRTA